MASKLLMVCFCLNHVLRSSHAVPEPGIKHMVFKKETKKHYFAKSLFKDAKISIKGRIVNTQSGEVETKSLNLVWKLYKSDCAQAYMGVKEEILDRFDVKTVDYYNEGTLSFDAGILKTTDVIWGHKAQHTDVKGKGHKVPNTDMKGKGHKVPNTDVKGKGHKAQNTDVKGKGHKVPNTDVKGKGHKVPHTDVKGKRTKEKSKNTTHPGGNVRHKREAEDAPSNETTRQSIPGEDGNYLLIITVSPEEKGITVEVDVSIKSSTGYLSAAEWPLLPFYGTMSLVYLAYGVVWLIVSAYQWRDLLRIQFWIGGVIALGMLEKAVLFSEYNNVNMTGVPAHGVVVLALVLSCIKRSLSRILILIVSMGFGIVKPRLGAALHRVLGVGCLHFILCIIEGSYRDFAVKADVSQKQVIASVPLSVLDAVICWWIFMSLLQTMRTLRIRKNVVKLSLYRHFTNILAVSVVASVAFMVWVIKVHSFNPCIKDWKELWIDDAFWHFLFALILLAIMILWRPTANNQRYAFTPLIDVGDEDDDDMTLSDAFEGMKARNKSETAVPDRAEKQRKKAEDDLKWVEENIPTAGGIDTALPSLLDSDEEVMTTKLEMNKME